MVGLQQARLNTPGVARLFPTGLFELESFFFLLCPQIGGHVFLRLHYRQDRMATVGGLQIAEQKVILYPVDNRDDDSNEDQHEAANVGA
jgi:hypothetical protein